MKHEKSSNVTCLIKNCSTRSASKYTTNGKKASSLSYMLPQQLLSLLLCSKTCIHNGRWTHTRPITDSRIKWRADDTYIKWDIPLT